MKIKALKTFVSGRYVSRDEVVDYPDKTGQKLVRLGLAEPVVDAEQAKAPAADKEPAAPKKKASGKSGAKTSTSK